MASFMSSIETNGKVLRAHPFAAVTWATHVDLETGRPVENPEVDYTENGAWVSTRSSRCP